MIEQVRFIELFSVGGTTSTRTVFGFGTHPQATESEAHPVTLAKATGNKFRIIIDELLRGNNLEEIECRFAVDDDIYDRVPVGATPDDIARCSVAQDVLPSRCPGSNRLSVCLCKNDGGCLSGTKPDGTPNVTPRGASVGVLDLDQDGAADHTHFISGAVVVTCGEITVPADLTGSYWTPSGNQQKPAQGGFDALGPAVVLVPGTSLPTSTECGLAFSSEVVDKDGIAVCAPPDGEIAAGCTPGDTSAITFTVEPLTFAITTAVPPLKRTDDIVIAGNAMLDAASLANVTMTEAGAPYTTFTATLGGTVGAENQIRIRSTAVGGLAANTAYTITVPTTVTDFYHQPAKQPFQISFTTGAN